VASIATPALGRRSTGSEPEWDYILRAVANVQLGEWAAARDALEDHYGLPSLIFVTPMGYDFLRSLIDSHLGLAGEARESYARGMAEWTVQTGGNANAWANSDVMRWRREAEAVLAK